MPTKPAKYGIKLWMCCDAETKYVYNASVYCGKENASEATCRDLGGKVVRQLLEPLHCEGRNITTDNYFTSLGLARDLLKAKKALWSVLFAPRVELPKEFVTPAGRELYTLCLSGSTRLVIPHCFLTNVRKTKLLSTCRLHLSDITFGKEPKKIARSHQLLQHEQRRS